MFHYSRYWGTWSRVLLQPSSLVDGVRYGNYLEVNLTPIGGYAASQQQWDKEVKPIILRQHGTYPEKGEMQEKIPPMAVTSMMMHVGADLTGRLVMGDLLSEIDLNLVNERMQGGGIPLARVLKSIVSGDNRPQGMAAYWQHCLICGEWYDPQVWPSRHLTCSAMEEG